MRKIKIARPKFPRAYFVEVNFSQKLNTMLEEKVKFFWPCPRGASKTIRVLRTRGENHRIAVRGLFQTTFVAPDFSYFPFWWPQLPARASLTGGERRLIEDTCLMTLNPPQNK